VLVEAAKIGDHLPYIPQMPEIITALSVELNKTATGQQSVDALLKAADQAVDDILQTAGGCQ
jgi:ABC-type glycerol-3-phosphate transport system substrate-binding protein